MRTPRSSAGPPSKTLPPAVISTASRNVPRSPRASADVGSERVILDPNELDGSKGRTTIDFYKPSYDGRYVALSLSENGSEQGTAYVYDTANGQRLPDVVVGVNYPTAGGSIEWAADSRGFYYTRYPQGNERPAEDRHFYQQVYFHELGTPTE